MVIGISVSVVVVGVCYVGYKVVNCAIEDFTEILDYFDDGDDDDGQNS